MNPQGFFAPQEQVPFYYLILSPIRLIWTTITPFWSYQQDSPNPQADIEGPLYVMGPPSRQIEPGRAVLASKELLEQFSAFLFMGRVIATDGAPLADANIDVWHADTKGNYYLRTYMLRGTVRTDSNGNFEILTVPCGRYGVPYKSSRPGHFHLIITPPKSDKTGSRELVTQQYLCPKNDVEDLKHDMFNTPDPINLLKSWGIPDESGNTHLGLPSLGDDAETQSKIDFWNKKLIEAGSSAKIVAGGFVELKLNKTKGWF